MLSRHHWRRTKLLNQVWGCAKNPKIVPESTTRGVKHKNEKLGENVLQILRAFSGGINRLIPPATTNPPDSLLKYPNIAREKSDRILRNLSLLTSARRDLRQC